MEIKVTSCADCPFAYYDRGCDLNCCCKTELIVQKQFENREVHPSCPLKQQSITVKLENDNLLNELRKSEIY